MIFRRHTLSAQLRVFGRIESVAQELELEPSVLSHLAEHRQSDNWVSEAGGQLFGTISPAKVTISHAVGPHAGDERSRNRYRSNPLEAQRTIDRMKIRGLLYLGEWHTHAENHPHASGLDDDAMRRLIANSRLNSNALLMLIVGRAAGVDGLAIWSVSSAATHSWQLRGE